MNRNITIGSERMLLLTQRTEDICYSELMRVYEESNIEIGKQKYRNRTANEQILLAEQDLYSYLCFVLDNCGWFAAWTSNGRYQAALRLETYSDGFLICALETAPEARGRGHATTLLRTVIEAMPAIKIYAHIYVDNKISIHIHEKLGFVKVSDSAEFLDGTVSFQAKTYMLNV